MKLRLTALLALTMLAGCRHTGDIDEETQGVYAVRSTCPILGVPSGTGDITLFNPPSSTDSRAIDVTATVTDVRGTCQDAGNDVVSTATFTVVALRRDAGSARQVLLPYFDVALQGGTRVVAKQIGQAAVNFAAGDIHGWTRIQTTVRVNRGAATLPASVRAAITRERKPGDPQAALDPLSDPAVRLAVANATFEHLVGFQLTQEQIRYNATR
ncbi:hypothetical protein [Sphingomonas sp. URHD0057]|uniref:hypothetical protein n=1 Tax=Sphingomonas sp. URHD0057 TaxID=1380389 RepID=UPI000B042BD3|nr:hypothetical protein [Sphingomonas sp. URHD0057]